MFCQPPFLNNSRRTSVRMRTTQFANSDRRRFENTVGMFIIIYFKYRDIKYRGNTTILCDRSEHHEHNKERIHFSTDPVESVSFCETAAFIHIHYPKEHSIALQDKTRRKIHRWIASTASWRLAIKRAKFGEKTPNADVISKQT